MNNTKMVQKRIQIFCIALFGLMILFWLMALYTRGWTLVKYFHTDKNDSFMDYFHMLANVEPYANKANYPALPFLIWRLLRHLIPDNEYITDGFYLRSTYEAILGFVVFQMLNIFLIVEVLKNTIPMSKMNKIILPLSLVLSGPVLYALERGNIILLALGFTLLFCLLYNNNKKWVRLFAYLFLAIAVAIKIYPGVFAVLILLKKRYKEFAVFLGMCLLCYIIPFFFFDNWIEAIKTVFVGIGTVNDLNRDVGFGNNFSFLNDLKIISAFLGKYVNRFSSFYLIIPVIVCAIIFFFNKETWKKLVAVSLFIVWIPEFNPTYILIFFIPALIYFLKSNKNKFEWFYMCCFVLIFSPIALPSIQRVNEIVAEAGAGEQYPLYGGYLVINIVLLLFALALVVEGCYMQLNKVRHINDKIQYDVGKKHVK